MINMVMVMTFFDSYNLRNIICIEDDGKFILECHQEPKGPPSLPDGVMDD